MAEEITIQLFPPVAVGLRVVNLPQGQLPVPEPCYQYTGVKGVEVAEDRRSITFMTRSEEKIESNLLYLVKREYKPEGEA